MFKGRNNMIFFSEEDVAHSMIYSLEIDSKDSKPVVTKKLVYKLPCRIVAMAPDTESTRYTNKT